MLYTCVDSGKHTTHIGILYVLYAEEVLNRAVLN